MEQENKRSIQLRIVKLLFLYFVTGPIFTIAYLWKDSMSKSRQKWRFLLQFTAVFWQDMSFFWSTLWWLCNSNIFFFFLDVFWVENVWWVFHGKINGWKRRSFLSMTSTGFVNLFIFLLILKELNQFVVVINRQRNEEHPIVWWLEEICVMSFSY